MKTKLGIAAGVVVVGAILLSVGVSSSDSQPKWIESTPTITQTTFSKPTKTKAPGVSKTKENSPKTRKSKAVKPSPSKTPQDLGAEPTVRTDYANCTELRKDFPKGIPDNHPAYRKKFDRDGDGFACEVD